MTVRSFRSISSWVQITTLRTGATIVVSSEWRRREASAHSVCSAGCHLKQILDLLGSSCFIKFWAISIHPTGRRNYLAKLAPRYDGPGDEGQHSEDFDDPGWEQRWSKSPLSCGRNSFGMTALVARSERSQNPSQHFLSVSLYCKQELLAWMLWLITLCRIVWC